MPNVFKVRRKGYDSSKVTPDEDAALAKADELTKPPSLKTILLSSCVVCLIASYHGAAVSLYDTRVFGELVYQSLVVPNMYIWGIMALVTAVYPEHVHSRRDWCTYAAFSALSVAFKLLANFGPQGAKGVFQGLYFVMVDGLWLLAIFNMYGVRPSQPDPNLTYLRFMLIPLFIYSTIYDITYYIGIVSVGLVTVTIWILYSFVVGAFMLLFDVPVDYFRRFISGHFVQRYHIHLDGNYFAYYIWVIFNLGPGIGILLAQLLKANAGDEVPLNDAVILTLALQLFGIIACHVAEVVSRRAWDGVHFKWLNMQIYFTFNMVQALLFLQVDPWDWRFLKMAAAQEAANLVKNSACKDVVMWLLGVRQNLPLVDKTQRSLVVKFGSDIALEFLALLAAYVLFLTEDATKGQAAPFTIQREYNSTLETSIPGDMCAATCMGWRYDYGMPSEDYAFTGANRKDAGKAAAVLASAFALRFLCIKIEAKFLKNVYHKFQKLGKSQSEIAKLKAVKPVGAKVEVTKKWKDLSTDEISGWLMNHLAALFYKEVEDSKLHDKASLEKLTADGMDRANLFTDTARYRGRLLTVVKDGIEYGVEVETVQEADEAGSQAFEKDLDAPIDLKGVFYAPKLYLFVSFWFAIHFATWAANAGSLRLLKGGVTDSRGVH